jgi:molybdenum cofactor biosynthesis enzyme MoaA
MSTTFERVELSLDEIGDIARAHAELGAQRWDAWHRRHIGTPILRRDIPKVLKELRANGGKGHIRIDADGRAYRHE